MHDLRGIHKRYKIRWLRRAGRSGCGQNDRQNDDREALGTNLALPPYVRAGTALSKGVDQNWVSMSTTSAGAAVGEEKEKKAAAANSATSFVVQLYRRAFVCYRAQDRKRGDVRQYDRSSRELLQYLDLGLLPKDLDEHHVDRKEELDSVLQEHLGHPWVGPNREASVHF